MINRDKILPTKGYTEERLKKYLKDRSLNILDYCYPHIYCDYFPDIVIEAKGVIIDIEIDEPYVYKSKEPTHWIDNIIDSERNNYFTKSNWPVIRFTEEQVCLNIEKCYLTIQNVIDHIVTGVELKSYMSASLWTRDEAERMANSDFRKTYLFKEEFAII
ncbi:DUF559 domain-containing protein [Pedobacter alpinus]|uniref:DUF559 domain-containing protein n=1 Tax=Pedobacter alpinus TaxID=1590643 RepID=A0ABW5TT99_9SPHI